MITENLTITPEYGISIVVVVLVVAMLMKKSPQMNTFIIVVIGVLVGYAFLVIMNNVFPYLNQWLANIKQYIKFLILNRFNNMGYFHIFPPILLVLILFIILLYNKNI
jgi:hypothetical protein